VTVCDNKNYILLNYSLVARKFLMTVHAISRPSLASKVAQ